MTELDLLDINTLREFYSRLHENSKDKLKRNQKSILLYFLKSRDATRFSILRKSSIGALILDRASVEKLLEAGYIQGMADLNSYAITAKGVWYMEKADAILDIDTLINYVNENFFIISKKDKMSNTEKVILLSLILARAFSKTSCVDLTKADYIKNGWLKVLETSFDIIEKYKAYNIKQKFSRDVIFRPRVNVHTVSYLFRHNNSMKQKTKAIYSWSGDQQYYLDIYRNGKIDKSNLGYLLYRIFAGKLTSEQIDGISDYCNKVSDAHSIYLFDVVTHEFAYPKYNRIIKESLIESVSKKSLYDNL